MADMAPRQYWAGAKACPAIHHFMAASATMKGERTTVTKHDEKGRIVEMIKVPLWANVQV
jgi:hypothetical protein